MAAKLQKYSIYIRQFLKSPIKGVIFQELLSEIQEKGLITGIQSLLHKRADYFFQGYDRSSAYDPIWSTKKFNRKLVFQLPPVQGPKVSVIIPMYNQVEHTFYCVRSIFEHNEYKNYEVIIADDNSPENTEFLTQHIENVVYIKNETNLGFLRNCNNAAKQAKGDYIVFLNNDTLVKKDWLIELLNVFENFDKVGLVGSKLVYPNGKLQEAGGIIWQDGSGWNYGNQDHADKPEYNYVKEVDYISGAAIMIDARLWEEVGGFDELYLPAYCEDSDFCFEVRKRGYKVIYQPFSVVTHFEGVSHGKDLNSGIKQYQVANNKKLRDKWSADLKLKSKNGENVFSERDRSGNKKHILVVDHNLPTVDQDAGSRTMSNYVDSLVSLGYSVKFLSTNPHPSGKYKKPLQEKGVEVFYSVEENLFNFHWDKYLKDNFEKYDVILLSRSSICMPLIIHLRNNHYKGKVIYYGHDLGYLRLDQETIMKDDIALNLQSKKLKAEEDFMYEYADHSLVISYEEMRFLQKYITQPLHYIPPYFFDVTKEDISYDSREGIMFIGGFNHPPNQDAIAWFMEEVYEPLFNLNIKMTIAGSNVPEFVYEYKKRFNTLDIFSNISVENLEQLYAKVKMSIVPLRVGAGVKGKVIEAMSKGVPVVGTFTAFEGLPKDDTFPYKGVNTAKEMQFNILEIYSDKERWDKISRYGKEYVQRYFNREGMKNTFRDIIG
jgi:GT2 family glycosyltransferase/glycosyltransferase involved in cell wall biosynthesis